MPTVQPAVTSFLFGGNIAAMNNKYIDTAQIASFVNRRTYQQGKCYFLESVKIAYHPKAADNSCTVFLNSIHDTWVTRNAWVKAKALWDDMNKKVLEDNPSVQGKWRNFKVFMDSAHFSGGSGPAGPTLNLLPQDSAGSAISTGEWEMSELIRPQHEVDAATGLPLAADAFHLHMLGADVGSTAAGSALNSGAVIQMYEDTRARVVTSPEVPAEMSTSWGTLLTDDGSQEPELADIIETESDEPPYDKTDYVGGDANWSAASLSRFSKLTIYNDMDLLPGFALPLGLLKLGVSATGEDAANSTVTVELNFMKGFYKGFATTDMEQ